MHVSHTVQYKQISINYKSERNTGPRVGSSY